MMNCHYGPPEWCPDQCYRTDDRYAYDDLPMDAPHDVIVTAIYDRGDRQVRMVRYEPSSHIGTPWGPMWLWRICAERII